MGDASRTVIPYDCDIGNAKRIYIDRDTSITVFDMVYEPAEDSWLTIDCIVAVKQLIELPSKLFIDVGTGSGIIAFALLRTTKNVYKYVVLVDINPCAAVNAKLNSASLKLDYLTDIVQCDSLSCIRRVEEYLIAYNTPYLPVEDAGLEGLAWSGGLREAIRVSTIVKRFGRGCIVVTFSSLSGSPSDVAKVLADSGFRLICERRVHVFFEDIVSMAACKP